MTDVGGPVLPGGDTSVNDDVTARQVLEASRPRAACRDVKPAPEVDPPGVLSAEELSMREPAIPADATHTTQQRRNIKILFFAANAESEQLLAIGKEHDAIDASIRSSRYRGRFQLIARLAGRLSDLHQALLDHQPDIVHFACHGSARAELLLAGDAGCLVPVSAATLSDSFRVLKDNLKLIVFNACFSSGQALAVRNSVPLAVGMERPIEDSAAIAFAAELYRALASGRSVQDAFDLGVAVIKGIPNDPRPRLSADKITAAGKVRLVENLRSPAVTRRSWLPAVVRLLVLISMIATAVMVATLCRVVIQPGTPWLEFLTHLKGGLITSVVAVPFVLGPLSLLLGDDSRITKLRRNLVATFLSTQIRGAATAVALVVLAGAGLLIAARLDHGASFDRTFERCELAALRFEIAVAGACLGNLSTEASTPRHHQQLALGGLCVEVATLMRDRSTDAGAWQTVLANAEEWEQHNVATVFSRVVVARATAHAGDAEGALRVTSEADRLARGDDQEALTALVRGEIEISRNNWARALVAYEAARDKNPAADEAEILKNLALIYFQLRRWNEAEAMLQRSLEKYGGVEQRGLLLSNIGFLQTLQGETAKAEATLQAALGFDSEDVVTQQNIAILKTLEKEYPSAEHLFTAIAARPLIGNDRRRNSFLWAWSRLRNPDEPEYRVIMALQEADGQADEEAAIALARNPLSMIDEMMYAADLVDANRGTYGLEFIEAAFLCRAIAYHKDPAKRAALSRRLAGLPPAVAAVSSQIVGSCNALQVSLAIHHDQPGEIGSWVSINSAPPVLRHDGDTLWLEPGDRLELRAEASGYLATPPQYVIEPDDHRVDVALSQPPLMLQPLSKPVCD